MKLFEKKSRNPQIRKKMHRVQFKIEKQAPVSNECSENVELFHGIGNKLGFNITGGSDFNMRITIFHVSRDLLRHTLTFFSFTDNRQRRKCH